MLVSSRAIQPVSIRRASSSISSISSVSSTLSEPLSKYGFDSLLESPLPSPGLPSILPRHGKKPPPFRLRSVVRFFARSLVWVGGIALVYWLGFKLLEVIRSPDALNYLSRVGEAYQSLGDHSAPQEPSPIIVIDKRGKPKWTVSIPPTLKSPLRPNEYAKICQQSEAVARHLRDTSGYGGSSQHGGRDDYYRVDGSFLDVDEAESQGLSPAIEGKLEKWSWEYVEGNSAGEKLQTMQDKKTDEVCDRSLTYVLETNDAGFGKTLIGLWMSYGLAKKEGRAFFIDDTNWAYGSYATFFQPPPTPSCLPPPYNHRLPCPHQARHLLVSASTTLWTFGRAFQDRFQDTHKAGVLRQQPIFSLLRTGYEALFHLASTDAEYLSSRLEDLAQTRAKGGITVGVHIRHGDRHPWEFQYQKSYIPHDIYTNTIHNALNTTLTVSDPNITDHTNTNPFGIHKSSQTILASDDPDVYISPDFTHFSRAQSQILLASKTALDQAQGSQPPRHPFIEENLGWEGGFFKDVFWGLGSPHSGPSPQSTARKEHQHPTSHSQLPLQPAAVTTETRTSRNEQQAPPPPSALALQLRELVGRAYLLDLAVVGHADVVVCGIASVACRVLGVMMGWEAGIVGGGWRNVDGKFEWTGAE